MLLKCADYISENLNQILLEWMSRAKEKIEASAEITPPALIDHIPDFLKALAAELRDEAADLSGAEDTSHESAIAIYSKEHGRARAQTSKYNLAQVLKEYHILREVISSQLVAADVASFAVLSLVNKGIELASLHAVVSFTESIQLVQTKLLAVLAHDIRTPLATSSHCFELLGQNSCSIQEERQHLVPMGQRNVARAMAMLEEILDTVRLSVGSQIPLVFEKEDFSKFISETIKDAQLRFGESIQLELSSEPVISFFDRSAIGRILENLISNAVKYGDSLKPIKVSVQSRSGMVELSVHNWGQAIPSHRQSEIFEFLNCDISNKRDSSRSWGIGLSLIREVAAAHGGDVSLSSSQKDGTLFTVKLANKPDLKSVSRVVLI